MRGASWSAERPKLVPSELGCNDAHQPPLGPHVSIHRSCRVAHPSASIAHTSSFICPNASRQVSTHPSRPSSLLHYDACYLYGKVAVCVAVAVTCDTCLRYGAAAHASLPGQNALPSSCTRTHGPPILGVTMYLWLGSIRPLAILAPLPLIRSASGCQTCSRLIFSSTQAFFRLKASFLLHLSLTFSQGRASCSLAIACCNPHLPIPHYR